jgi:hypothetical protein
VHFYDKAIDFQIYQHFVHSIILINTICLNLLDVFSRAIACIVLRKEGEQYNTYDLKQGDPQAKSKTLTRANNSDDLSTRFALHQRLQHEVMTHRRASGNKDPFLKTLSFRCNHKHHATR